MATTIRQVARRAGVSTATVSRVLAGVGAARPETRARVVAAARDLGYRPSGIARSLKLRSTRTLGLIVTDIENPFFPQLVRAVEDAAWREGYALLLCNAANDPDREAGYLELLVDRRVDGVVIAASSLGTRQGDWLRDPPLPVVLVNCASPGGMLPGIASDNRGGGRLAIEHLVGLGHRRFGHVTARPRNVDAPDRLEGARDGIVAAGLAADALVVVEGDAVVAGGEEATRGILDVAPETTAVFAYNDLMAIGAIRAFRAAGRRVPDDASVVGFDDVDLAAYVEPPLTTIAQATAQMGSWAVDRLIDSIAEPREPSEAGRRPRGEQPFVQVPVRLRVRSSTAAAPNR